MKSRIGFVAKRMARNRQESGTDVLLQWNAYPPGAIVDPVTQVPSGMATPQSQVLKALLHFVGATSTVRQFNEIQTGDCLLDLDADVDLTGRSGLVFLLPSGFAGTLETWTSKPLSAELSAHVDVIQSGLRVGQTVLLRKAT